MNNMIQSIPVVGEAYKGISSAIGGRRKLGGMAVLRHTGGYGPSLISHADSIPIYRGPTENMKEVFGAGLPHRIGGSMPSRVGGAMMSTIDLTRLSPEEIAIAQQVMGSVSSQMPKWDLEKHLNRKGKYYVPDKIAKAFSPDFIWNAEEITNVIDHNKEPMTLAAVMTLARYVLANPRIPAEMKEGWIKALIQGISYSNFKSLEQGKQGRFKRFRRNFRRGGRRMRKRGRRIRRRHRRIRPRLRRFGRRRLGYGKRKTGRKSTRLPPRDRLGRFRKVKGRRRKPAKRQRRKGRGRRRRFTKRYSRRRSMLRFKRRFNRRRRRGGLSEIDYNTVSPYFESLGDRAFNNSRVQTLLNKIPQGARSSVVDGAKKLGKFGLKKLLGFINKKIAKL